MSTPSISSPYAPDIAKVRAWIEEKIAARLFVEVVTAIVALLVRMRDANVELFTKLAHLKRRRPPSETLARLERQLVLPLFVVVPPKKRGPSPPIAASILAGAPSPTTSSASRRRTTSPKTCAPAPCVATRW